VKPEQEENVRELDDGSVVHSFENERTLVVDAPAPAYIHPRQEEATKAKGSLQGKRKARFHS
jgi:hypothetical protein